MSKKRKFSLEKNSRYAYAIPLSIVMLFMVIFYCYNLYQTSNAYYLLSTLIQSEAAILGIVITLSLVAVQLTASSYSPRVTQVFKKTPDLWVITCLYIFAITTGLALLKNVNKCPESDFEIYISLSYFTGVFCFASLIPYIYRLFYLLKPRTIIKRLSEAINVKNLAVKELQSEEDEENPLQPILDIVRSSMMKYDYETFRYGLRTIRIKICDILKKKEIRRCEAEKISKRVYEKLYEIGQLAVGREDEYSIMDIINVIKEIGKAPITVESEKKDPKEFEEVLSKASRTIGLIGKAAAKKGLVMPPASAVMALGELGELSARKILSSAVENTLNYYWKIGKMIVEEGETATGSKLSILGTLKKIGMVTVEKGMENEARHIVKHLNEFVDIADDKMEKQELQLVLRNVMSFLMEFLKETDDRNLEKPKFAAMKLLRSIVEIVEGKQLEVDISDAKRLLQ